MEGFVCADLWGFFKALGLKMFELNDKVALIIGIGQTSDRGWGIGTAIAVQLARRGAIIYGGNRSLASTTLARNTILSEGGRCTMVETDATDSASVSNLVSSCMEQYGRIDILVTNVGLSQPGCPASMSESTWDSQININLKSAYLATHHVLPIMEEQSSGSIICISSIASLRHLGKDQIAYNTAKAALLQFVKATGVIYAAKGVRINAVVPGLMDTPYTRSLADRFGADYDTFCESRNAQIPMKRMGSAWDVANATVFLASDESSYITGQKIVVDGGITSKC